MTTSKARKFSGSIDVIAARKGYVRIDACVPQTIAHAMLHLASSPVEVNPRLMKATLIAQHEVGGNVLMDLTVSAPLATLMLAEAKRRGATAPRRHAA